MTEVDLQQAIEGLLGDMRSRKVYNNRLEQSITRDKYNVFL